MRQKTARTVDFIICNIELKARLADAARCNSVEGKWELKESRGRVLVDVYGWVHATHFSNVQSITLSTMELVYQVAGFALSEGGDRGCRNFQT